MSGVFFTTPIENSQAEVGSSGGRAAAFASAWLRRQTGRKLSSLHVTLKAV
jgi:hypothetical protein